MSFDQIPDEICIKILSYLDFERLQKTCTLVCQRWIGIIRNSGVLSGQLALNYEKMVEELDDEEEDTDDSDNDTDDDCDTNDDTDDDKMTTKANGAARSCVKPKNELRPSIDLIKKILSNWKQLRILRLPFGLPKDVDLKSYSTIRKVILSKKNDPNLIHPKKAKWITMSKICFDPQEKSSRMDRILLDTESSKKRKKAPVEFFPEIAMELKILLDFYQLYHAKVQKSLEQVVSKMINLVTLCIRLSSDMDIDELKCCHPALNGLKSCQNLKELVLILDDHVGIYNSEGKEAMHTFMDIVATNCPNVTKLEILGGKGEYELKGFTWIPRLTNLEELSIISQYPGGILKRRQIYLNMFYDNPMAKLKHLKFDCRGSFDEPEFLMKLHTTFPALESFTFEGPEYWRNLWSLKTIVGVLESLGNVKNLNISNVMIILKKSSQEEALIDIFARIIYVIEEKFPKNSTEFLIREDESKSMIMKEEGKSPWIWSCDKNIRESFPRETNGEYGHSIQ